MVKFLKSIHFQAQAKKNVYKCMLKSRDLRAAVAVMVSSKNREI
jgi:hypothetical protein